MHHDADNVKTIAVSPMDEHNQALVERLHPSDYVNPIPKARYNLVVIGAGAAGLVTAAIAASLGARVALIERHLMGGDCLNVGCVPSKALIRAARAAAGVRRAAGFGVRGCEDAHVDFPAVMERMRRIRAAISPHDSVQRFRDEYGIDVYLGQAIFVGRDAIEVHGRRLTFSKAVIATGSRPVLPSIDGLSSDACYTNESIFALTDLPGRLAVIGGGPIGCELAQAFARFGSRVTVLESGPRLLAVEDPAISNYVERAFADDGIRVLPQCTLHRVENGTPHTLHFTSGSEDGALAADAILVAAGRRPNVEDLGLDRAGVDTNQHGVAVNDRLQTTNRNIYAIGDVALKYRFTHAADASARLVVQNALFWGRKKVSALTMPWCTYTDPGIAHVGHNETSAEKAGIAIDTYTRDFADVDRARIDGDTDGCVRVHCVKGKDTIVGATVVARHAGEMINEITVAMTHGLGLAKLADVIHPYPTQAEAIRQCGDAYRRGGFTPTRKKLLERFFRWRR